MKCPLHRPRLVCQTETATHQIFTLYCEGCDKNYTRRKRKPCKRFSSMNRTKASGKSKDASGGKCVRKKGIPRQSSSKAKWQRIYRETIDRDTLFGVFYDLEWRGQEPVIVRKVGGRLGTTRHHPLGRQYCRIVFYRHCTDALHDFCHGQAKLARKIGALLPEFEGRDSPPDQPDPFQILPEYQSYIETHGLR